MAPNCRLVTAADQPVSRSRAALKRCLAFAGSLLDWSFEGLGGGAPGAQDPRGAPRTWNDEIQAMGGTAVGSVLSEHVHTALAWQPDFLMLLEGIRCMNNHLPMDTICGRRAHNNFPLMQDTSAM